MCRALKVLCIAPDPGSLDALKKATVSADWELCLGAVNETDALATIDIDRPHALVAFGAFENLVALVRERFPGMRIVVDRDTPGATEVASSLEDVRGLLRSSPRPGGPVGN